MAHATWMNPEDIMLKEIIQSQKDKYSMTPLVSKIVKLIETESRIVIARSWG